MTDDARITISQSDEARTVTGAGSLDLHIVEEFKKALDDAAESGRLIVVDFRPAIYIDTAIIAALGWAARGSSETDKRMRVLVAKDSHPEYVLRIVGFDGLMDIVRE